MKPNLPRLSFDEDDDDPDAAPASESTPPPSYFQCADCGVRSPPTRTGETLISSQHGWRAARVPLADGRIRVDWRCATCWTAYRAKKLGTF